MPRCPTCRAEVRGVAAFCPECGAPLSDIAARLREAGSPEHAPPLMDTRERWDEGRGASEA